MNRRPCVSYPENPEQSKVVASASLLKRLLLSTLSVTCFLQAPVKFDSALIGSDSYAAMHDFKAVRNFLAVQKVHHSLRMMSEADISSPLTKTLDPELF